MINKIRLVSVYAENAQDGDSFDGLRIRGNVSKVLEFPKGIDISEIFKYVSYVYDRDERCYDVMTLGGTLAFVHNAERALINAGLSEEGESMSFDVNRPLSSDEKIVLPISKLKDVTDVFVFNNLDEFEKTECSDRFVDWYTDGVTTQDVWKTNYRIDFINNASARQ